MLSVRLDTAVDETNQSGQKVTVQVGDKHQDVLQNQSRLVWWSEAVREFREASGRVTARGLAAGSRRGGGTHKSGSDGTSYDACELLLADAKVL